MRSKCVCLSFVLLSLTYAAVTQTTVPQASAASAEQKSPPPAAQEPTEQKSNFTSAKGFVLEDGTPIKMRINRTISSGDAHVGDTVDFEVLEDISVNGTLVIAKGGLAFATVTEAQAKRRMARGGKLDINIDYVKLLSSEKAALRAVKEVSGGGHTGAMTGGIVATSLVFFPAAPFFLFMHGKDISIPKGTEITAYVNGDMKLDLAKFQPVAPASSAQSAVQQAATPIPNQSAGGTSAKLQLDSNPPGADIEIDGNFVGNTPSQVQVAEGEHAISIKKAGFTIWQRTIKVSAGSSILLNAELEKVVGQ